MNIIVGTRGSKLALTQTQWVIEQLKNHYPNVNFEVKVIKTKGDQIQHLSLDKIGDKGLFVKEIEQQLLEKKIDMAVHSMKDMPSSVTKGLKFAGIPKRENPQDILILKDGYHTLEDLPTGAKIGTGSKRRKYQLLNCRPDLQIVSIRGNIDTRIKKIQEENLDGIVLAAAGVLRAGMSEVISTYLPIDMMIPAPAQGALAIQIRENDLEIEQLIDQIKDMKTEICIAAERAFLKGVNGGCHVPMGAYCEMHEERLKLTGLYGNEEGDKLIIKTLEGNKDCAVEIGLELAKLVLKEYDDYEG